MHVHSSGWSTTYTPLHVATMLFADTDCCTRTYVYTLPRLRTSQQRVKYTTMYEVPFISKVYDRNPKSTIEIQSLLSLQAALRAIKSLENCPFLHQLPPNFIQVNQLDLSEGRSSYKLFTPLRWPSANTKPQLNRSAATEPVRVGHTAILRDM